MTISETLDMRELRDRCWNCDDFWRIIDEQDLYDALDDYLSNVAFPDEFPDITEVNDLFRHNGDEVLHAIGAAATNFDDEI